MDQKQQIKTVESQNSDVREKTNDLVRLAGTKEDSLLRRSRFDGQFLEYGSSQSHRFIHRYRAIA